MQWEALTAADLQTAARTHGVCVINFAVLEKHADHLPLGTDLFIGHQIACRAAQREPAVVFPPYYFGKVYEATCYPGAIALEPRLLLDLALNLFREIARNGFKKILLHNSHGGNWAFLRFLTQCNIAEACDYTLYLPETFVPPHHAEAHNALCAIPPDEHAGAVETALMLALLPEHVRTEKTPAEDAAPRQRLQHLPGIFTGVSWYANYPDHYAGNAASNATQEQGGQLVELYTRILAERIKAVKEDRRAPALKAHFEEQRRNPI